MIGTRNLDDKSDFTIHNIIAMGYLLVDLFIMTKNKTRLVFKCIIFSDLTSQPSFIRGFTVIGNLNVQLDRHDKNLLKLFNLKNSYC